MADTKISELTAATLLTGAESVPLVQSGANKRATALQIAQMAGFAGPGEVVRLQYANGPGGTVTNLGWEESTSGSTTTPAIATTNRLTRQPRAGRITSAAAGSEALFRTFSNLASRDVGFTYGFRGGIETAAGSTTRLLIAGRLSSTNPGNVEPSSLVSFIGVGCDSTDANLQIMHNDASGTATKVDTGIAKAAGDELVVILHCDAGGNPVVTLYHFAGTNLTSTPTTTVTQTLTTDLPASSSALQFGAWISNGSTASAANIARTRQTLRTPF